MLHSYQLPKKIRIGGTDYNVVEVSDLTCDKVELNGHIIYNDNEIRVEAAMTQHKKWVTLWHEVIHGILEHAGHDDHEERIVMALGYGIAQVLRDNPPLRIDNDTA